MRGSLRQRNEGSWSLILNLGDRRDPVTGTLKRKQKWVTFRGTKKDAQTKLTELLNDLNKGTFVELHKRTFGGWLTEWLDKAIKPPHKTPRSRMPPIKGSSRTISCRSWATPVCKN